MRMTVTLPSSLQGTKHGDEQARRRALAEAVLSVLPDATMVTITPDARVLELGEPYNGFVRIDKLTRDWLRMRTACPETLSGTLERHLRRLPRTN